MTNPPFSLFREFVTTLMEHNKKFIIIGNQNAITYKDFFPYIMNNEIWLGNGFEGNVGFFSSPYEDIAVSSQHKDGMIRVSGVMWFTNLDIKKRHEQMILVKRYTPDEYLHYDNYNAINVDKTADIPCDYEGLMGVPITFLDKYSPDQFEILGVTQSWCGIASKIYPKQIQIDKNRKRSQVTKLNDGAAIKVSVPPNNKTYYEVNGELFIKTYARIIIRNKHPEPPKEVHTEWK